MTDFAVGDTVALTKDLTGEPTSGHTYYGSRENFDKGHKFIVTKIFKYRVTVKRTPNETQSYGTNSFNFDKTYLEKTTPQTPHDQVPEGGISPDDPRLEWLWDRAAKIAEEQHYCSQYDLLCSKLNIPGRKRSFSVKRNINGLDVTVKVQARSQSEADKLVSESLSV